MIKAELKVLERIFSKEIVGQLPAQFKSKHLAQLQARGYVEFVTVKLKGHPPCSVSGWVLTERGRFTYCESCKDVEIPPVKKQKQISTKNTHL